MYTNARWYRPHYNSFMRSLGRPIGQINADQLVKRVYQSSPDHIEVFRGALPTNTTLNVAATGSLAFSVTPMRPADHALPVAWYLDGHLRAGVRDHGAYEAP